VGWGKAVMAGSFGNGAKKTQNKGTFASVPPL
jgi:hypothetical protein